MKSVYGATRIHLGEDLKFILGANYTEIDTLEYKKNKVSPYAGITYNFTPEYTGYMSYTSILDHKLLLIFLLNKQLYQ